VTGPVLVACLVALRAEFDAQYPGRDKGADGWIGDAAHQQESSDHNPDETGRTPFEDDDKINEVHALDIDKDLRAAGGAAALNADVERIRLAHQTGRDDRLQNIIWQGRIASRSWGWDWHTYTGASKHFDHAHFSARYVTATENDTSPWGVKETDVTQAEFNAWMTSWATSEAGKSALASVLKRDGIIKAPAGATNADGTPNEFVSAATVLSAVYASVTPVVPPAA
jgi:hypothetical protein